MEIYEHVAGSVVVFELRGRLTLESFGRLKHRVRTLVELGGRRLILDLSGVSYVDSIGVSELVRSYAIIGNQGGRLVLAAIPAQVGQLLGVDELELHRAKRKELRELAEPVGDGDGWLFPDTDAGRDDRWWHANLSRLIDDLESLTAPSTGLLATEPDAVSREHGWSIPRRLAFAERLRLGMAEGGEWSAAWNETIEDIRTDDRHDGLRLPPQTGLVPLGRDPRSGLWEFWHVASGSLPVRGAGRQLEPDERDGIVLVLVPGGVFLMGAQGTDPNGANYDPQATAGEAPVHEVELSPYFLSKFELTQGQWLRLTGFNPSHFPPGSKALHEVSLRNPVESVSWDDCEQALARAGLGMPSEAQWEYGARAGGPGYRWSTGNEPQALVEVANLADRSIAGKIAMPTEDWDDGHHMHAAVGSFEPNEFGLHDLHGNVWEWCQDRFQGDFFIRSPLRDPVCESGDEAIRTTRGGSWVETSFEARTANRNSAAAFATRNFTLGVRPAAAITALKSR